MAVPQEPAQSSNWQDEYISEDPDGNGFICWDESGRFLCLTTSIEEARQSINIYCAYLNNKYNRGNCK